MKRSAALLVGLAAVCALGWFFVRDQIQLVEPDRTAATTESTDGTAGARPGRLAVAGSAAVPGQTLALETSPRLTLPAGGLARPARNSPEVDNKGAKSVASLPTRLLEPVRALAAPDSPFPRPLAYLALAALIGFFIGWLHRAMHRPATPHAPLTGRHPDHIDTALVSDKRAARRIEKLEKQLAAVGRAKADLEGSTERRLAGYQTQLDSTRREALQRGEQYARTRQQLDDALRQLDDLRAGATDTAGLREQVDELSSAARTLRQDLVARDERIRELDSHIAELEDAASGRDAALDDAAQTLVEVTRERDRLADAREHDRNEIEALTAQLAELGEHTERTAGEADEHRRRADDLTARLDEARNHLSTQSEAAHTQAAGQSAKIDQQAGELVALRAREQELEHATTQSRELAETLRRRLEEQTRRNDELTAAGTAHREAIATGVSQLAAERSRAAALEAELDSERANVARLTDQLDRLRAASSGDRNRAAGFSEQIQMLTDELAASHERRGELEQQVEQARHAARSARRELAEANDRTAELEAAIGRSAQDIDEALTWKSGLESELAAARHEIGDWRERTEWLQSDRDKLDTERATLIDELAGRDRRLDEAAARLDERLAEIDRLEQALASQAETHRELLDAGERLRADLKTGDRAVEELTAEVQARDARIAELTDEAAELAHMRDKLDAWDSSLATYRNDLRDRDAALAQAREEIDRLAGFEATSDELAAQILSLEKRLHDAQLKTSVRNERLARAAEEFAVLEALLADQDATVAASNDELDATEQRLAETQASETRLAGQLQAAEAALADVEARAWDLDQALAARIDEAANFELERQIWLDRLSPLGTRVEVLAGTLRQSRSVSQRAQRDVAALNEQLEHHQALLTARDADLAQLTGQLAATRDRLAEIKTDNDRLEEYKSRLEQWDSTVSTMRADLRRRDAINDELREQLVGYQDLKATSAGQHERIGELQARLDKQTRLAATLKRGVDSLRQYKKQAAEHLLTAHGLRRELDASMTAQTGLDARIVEQNDELARFEADSVRREADIAELRQTVAERDDALAETSRQLALVVSESEALAERLEQRETDIARLEEQLTDQGGEIASLSGALDDAQSVAAGLEATLRERHMDIDELTGAVEAKIADLEDLKVVADGLAIARDQAEAAAERRAGVIRELGDALDQAEHRSDTLESEVARLEALDEKLAAWDSTVSTLRDDLRERERTIDAFLDALADARGEPVERDAWPSAVGRLGDAASRAQTLQRELDASAERIDTLATQVAALDEERQSLADALQLGTTELDNRAAQIDELLAQAGQRDMALEHATVVTDERERQIAELRSQIETQHADSEALAEQLDQRTSLVEALGEEAAERQQHIDRLTDELADWQARSRQLDDTVVSHRETIERLENELEKKRVALEALEAQATEIQSLEAAARHHRDKMNELERRLEQRSSEALDLEQQVADWMHRAASAPSAPTLTSVVKSGQARKVASGDDKG